MAWPVTKTKKTQGFAFMTLSLSLLQHVNKLMPDLIYLHEGQKAFGILGVTEAVH